jgi:hypothetical protein
MAFTGRNAVMCVQRDSWGRILPSLCVLLHDSGDFSNEVCHGYLRHAREPDCATAMAGIVSGSAIGVPSMRRMPCIAAGGSKKADAPYHHMYACTLVRISGLSRRAV